MKIIFIGNVEFSSKILEYLIDLNANIVGLLTKKESEFNSDFVDLTPICKKSKIPFKQIEDINENENIKWIEEKKADIIFCFGFSTILKEPILNITKLGVLGYHPALIPKNRGRHPSIWPLVLGLKKTGSTFFFMDKGADSGDILDQKEIDISYDDDARKLYNKICKTAKNQIKDFLPKLSAENFIKIPQEKNIATYWRKRSKNDGKIDFRMSSKGIYNLVRALSEPYVGAHLVYRNEDIKVWRAKEIMDVDHSREPGYVLDTKENRLTVKCGENAIEIINHEFINLPKIGEYL